jgi:hypothetical protein
MDTVNSVRLLGAAALSLLLVQGAQAQETLKLGISVPLSSERQDLHVRCRGL